MYGATVFPHNIGLGAANDPDMILRIGQATAKEVAATGLDWTFAPTVAAPRDYRSGRVYEGYSEDPEIKERVIFRGRVSPNQGFLRPSSKRQAFRWRPMVQGHETANPRLCTARNISDTEDAVTQPVCDARLGVLASLSPP